MIIGDGGIAVWLWTQGAIEVAAVATALPMAWQIANISGWVAFNVTSIFENLGVVQEGMSSIAVPPTAPDPPGAVRAAGRRGARSASSGCASAMGGRAGVLHGLDLTRRAGRAGRAGRAFRRRQVDAGQPAAALLRAGGGPHPDRRPGHRRRHAGKPARRDRRGDAGHRAAAPLDPRQHPLRPAGGERRPRSRRPPRQRACR